MRICALLVGLLLACASAAARAPRIRVAKQAALAYWHVIPCGGRYTTVVGDLPAGVNAHASYFANNDGTVSDCMIVMARGQFGYGLHADFAFFCTVFTHEVGHLLQVRFHPGFVTQGVEDALHSPDPANLMYPDYLGGPQIPPGCQAGSSDRSPSFVSPAPALLFDSI